MLDTDSVSTSNRKWEGSRMEEDMEIIRSVLYGDIDKFEKLVDTYSRLVFSIVVRRVPDQDVETVSQDVFIRAFKSLKNYSFKKPFHHWLTTIALRSCCDYWRKHARKRQLLVDQPSDESLKWFDQAVERWSGSVDELRSHRSEASEILEYALSRLSPKDRMVIELTYLEGWSVKEASEKLEWSVPNVKVRAMRAKMKLRKIITTLRKRS